MVKNRNIQLAVQKTHDADVLPGLDPGNWQLIIPAGSQGKYRLAQLNDVHAQSRDELTWKPPVTLNLCARASTSDIPGTWGFGFWNDPFSLSLGLGGGTRRFPALPNAVWFFYASSQNYLSFRDDLPANGFIAQTFQSSRLSTPFLALGVGLFPLLLWSWLARKLRASLRCLIAEDSFLVNIDVTNWHSYRIEWQIDQVVFTVEDLTFETRIRPNGPLSFVLWIDNQYAAFSPNGKLSYGTLPNHQSAWLEIEALRIENNQVML